MNAGLVKVLNRLGTFLRYREDGNITIAAAFVAVPVLIGVGVAMDYNRADQVRTGLQTALDSAVLAAAENDKKNWKDAASASYDRNVVDALTVAGPPEFDFVKGTYTGRVLAQAETVFLGIAGIKYVQLDVKAAAIPNKLPLCVLGLNAFDSGAFDMNGNPAFSAPGCVVQANSGSTKGMTQEGNPPMAVAAKFGVSGGHTGRGYKPTPKDGSPAIPDPYAELPFPDHDPCSGGGSGMTINSGPVTLPPGTYCGGLTLKSGAIVTLQPGVYVMVDGSLHLNGGSTLTGKEVMIAFTGSDSTLRVWGNSALDLTSPTSGLYKNFQFFEDNRSENQGHGAWVSIGGNSGDGSKAKWDGVAYFPTQNFWVYGSAAIDVNSPGLALVAGQIWVQGDAAMTVTHDNPRQVAIDPPMVNSGATLVQ